MADSPADVKVVLDTIAKEAAQLCHAPFARVTVLQDGVLRSARRVCARRQTAPCAQRRARAPHLDPGSRPARAQDAPLTRTSSRSWTDEFPDARENARIMGFRAVLAVPLLRGDEGLGAIFLYRRERGLFTPDEVALVETFARQAAIALSSVRQFHATREALEQQTATSEILRVISSSRTDVTAVFETIAQSALTLCGAASSVVAHVRRRAPAHRRASRARPRKARTRSARSFHARPSRDNGVTRAVLTRALVADSRRP